jgi:mercuric ion binding protein
MKNLKSFFLLFAILLGVNLFAGVEKASIKTSAKCEMCKEALEASIGKMPGVQKVELNVETKVLLVKFDNSVTSLAKIKAEVSNTGYWADELAPNKEAYAALPSCCKPVKSCCASKTSCASDASKSSCASGEAKKECSKDGAAATPATPATPAKSTCTGHTH